MRMSIVFDPKEIQWLHLHEPRGELRGDSGNAISN